MLWTMCLVTSNLPDDLSPFCHASEISLEAKSLRIPTPAQDPAWSELLRYATGAPKWVLTCRFKCRPSWEQMALTVRCIGDVRCVSEKHQMPVPRLIAIGSLPFNPLGFEQPIRNVLVAGGW